MIHTLVLYAHLLSAALLMGATIAARFARTAVLQAGDTSALRGALDVARRISRANPVLALVLLASGAWLGSAGYWRSPWFWVAVAAWFANLLLAVKVVVPAGQRAGAAGAQTTDGPVPAELDALRREPAAAAAHDAMIGLDLAILAVMIAKPAPVEAIVWPLLGVMLMLLVRLGDRAIEARRAEATG